MSKKTIHKILRYVPLTIIIALIISLIITGIHRHYSLDIIRQQYAHLKAFAALHPFITPLLFIAIFTISTCLVIPDAFLLCFVAGFLFPMPLALLYIGISEAAGSLLFFFAVYEAFGETAKKKPYMKKIQKGLQENAANYLLFLKISHLFPYWLVNVAAAYFNVRPWTFFWTAFVSFLPGAFVFVEAGSGIETFLKSNEPFSLQAILNEKVEVAFFILAVCALLPLLFKKKHR